MEITNKVLLLPFERKPYILDIRTKIMLLVMISVFVLGGLGNHIPYLQHMVCAALFLLMLIAGKVKLVLIYGGVYLLSVLLTEYVFPGAEGGVQLFFVAMTIIFVKFMPMAFAGAYIVSTTTVSEFSAGLKKWHISDRIVVPFCVMFRMFPTISAEFRSINDAMRMRGITFDFKHMGKFVEYRIVPLIICVVKIGDELSQSAMTRGLGGDLDRVCVSQVRFEIIDYLMMILYLAVIALSIWFSVKA
ncbi:MAG: energy-coupling factor transporter transmembrane component T family protein [Roseburia sp.]